MGIRPHFLMSDAQKAVVKARREVSAPPRGLGPPLAAHRSNRRAANPRMGPISLAARRPTRARKITNAFPSRAALREPCGRNVILTPSPKWGYRVIEPHAVTIRSGPGRENYGWLASRTILARLPAASKSMTNRSRACKVKIDRSARIFEAIASPGTI